MWSVFRNPQTGAPPPPHAHGHTKAVDEIQPIHSGHGADLFYDWTVSREGNREPTSDTAIVMFIIAVVFIALCMGVMWVLSALGSGGRGASF